MNKSNAPDFAIDFRSVEFARDPYSIFALLRSEYPVCRLAENTYALSRYEDVRFALTHHELFPVGWGNEPVVEPHWLRAECKRGAFLGDKNPPELGKYIDIIDPVFAGRFVRSMVPLLEDTAQRLVDQARHRSTFDFVADFSYPMAGAIFAPMTGLDLDTKAALDSARYWVELSDSFLPECPTPDEKAAVEAFIVAQNREFDALISARRAHPHNGDAASILANATLDGKPLPDRELRGALNQFIIAGLTPALLFPTAIVVLSQRRELRCALQMHPEKLPAFVEELLRFEGVGQAMVRVAAADITLHGITIPAGARVLALTGSANRDAAQFPAPDQFLLDRDNIKNHLGFGHGAHLCLGAALARLEIKIALEALLAAFDEFECPSVAELDWNSSGITRSLRTLPVHFH